MVKRHKKETPHERKRNDAVLASLEAAPTGRMPLSIWLERTTFENFDRAWVQAVSAAWSECHTENEVLAMLAICLATVRNRYRRKIQGRSAKGSSPLSARQERQNRACVGTAPSRSDGDRR